jgi:mRNA-degrading endonuclease RelE of RelBE toxin-antitoxin system
MAYNVELSESAERELGKLDASQAKRFDSRSTGNADIFVMDSQGGPPQKIVITFDKLRARAKTLSRKDTRHVLRRRRKLIKQRSVVESYSLRSLRASSPER